MTLHVGYISPLLTGNWKSSRTGNDGGIPVKIAINYVSLLENSAKTTAHEQNENNLKCYAHKPTMNPKWTKH